MVWIGEVVILKAIAAGQRHTCKGLGWLNGNVGDSGRALLLIVTVLMASDAASVMRGHHAGDTVSLTKAFARVLPVAFAGASLTVHRKVDASLSLSASVKVYGSR